MQYEDEKDILGNYQNDHDDDAVSWDSIIEPDADGIVSIKNDSSASNNTKPESYSDVADISYDDAVVGAESDAEYINSAVNEDYSGDSDDIDEDELKRILNGENQEPASYDTYEEDSQDDDINGIQGSTQNEDILPRKEEIRRQNSASPVLIALIFCLLVAGGAFAFFNFMSNKNNEDAEAPMPPAQEEVQQSQEQMPQEEAMAENPDGSIPVINEDEVNTLTPEETKEEKKQVVSVIPTGRTNPFLPIPKYLEVPTSVKVINNIDYDSVSIPKPPKAYGEFSEMADKLMSISVSGIMYDAQKPSAIINYDNDDYFVQIGDKLNNFKVVDIGPTYVSIALGKNVYKANIGEQFKFKDFYGNVPYQGGGRQYYSSEDEYAKSTGKYTSENDVKVLAK